MALAAGALVVTLGAAYLLAPAADAPDRVAAGEPPEPEATGALPPAAAIAVPPRQAVPAGATALSGVPEVIDTITLRLRGEVVRLFAVEWDRGAQAEDLTAYIAGREVTCEPVGSTNTHRCTVDGRDLSQVVLYNGGGKAGPDATPVLREAEARARAEKVGVWR